MFPPPHWQSILYCSPLHCVSDDCPLPLPPLSFLLKAIWSPQNLPTPPSLGDKEWPSPTSCMFFFFFRWCPLCQRLWRNRKPTAHSRVYQNATGSRYCVIIHEYTSLSTFSFLLEHQSVGNIHGREFGKRFSLSLVLFNRVSRIRNLPLDQRTEKYCSWRSLWNFKCH